MLGSEANVSFDEGLRELVEWLSEEPAVDLTSVAERVGERGLVA